MERESDRRERRGRVGVKVLEDVAQLVALSARARAEVFQACSRCLKATRDGSHPERWISNTAAGKRPRPKDDTANDSPASAAWVARKVLSRMAQLIELSLLDSARAPAFESYFLLCAALDALKEVKRELHREPAASAILVLLDGMADCTAIDRADYVTQRAVDLVLFLGKQLSADAAELQRTQLRQVMQQVMHRITRSVVKSAADHVAGLQRERCFLVDPEASWSLVLGGAIRANVLLLQQQFQAPLALEDLGALVSLVERAQLFRCLAQNDSTLISVLLSLLELELGHRLEQREGGSQHPIVAFLEAHHLDAAPAFVTYLWKCLCFDASVALDLVSSTETEALRYVLRAVKVLAALSQPEWVLCLARCHGLLSTTATSASSSTAQTAASAASATAVIVRAWTSSGNSGRDAANEAERSWRVAACEWERTINDELWSAEAEPALQLSIADLQFKIETFLAELHLALARAYTKDLLPFDPQPLLRRIEAALAVIAVVEDEEEDDE